MKNTCCVPHCESRRSSVKLHRFPKTEIVRLKWVKILNSARLKDLSLEELQKFFVCHKHFEKRFVTDSFRLHIFAYPTLFSNEEIDTGIPAHEDSENQNILRHHYYTHSRKRRHEDHSYYKFQPLKELVKIKLQDYSVPSTSKLFKTSCQKEALPLQDIADNMSSATSENTTDCEAKQQLMPESPQYKYVVTPKKITRWRFVIKKKNLTLRCHKMLKEYKNAKKQLNFAIRCKRAMKFSKKENFHKVISNLSPREKKLLWLQITQCTKQTKGWRFSDEETNIALAIMKQSPRSYKFLRRIFILPSIRTINKMTSKMQVESSVNLHIFNAMKTEVENWQESKKYCSLAFDDVALEPGVSYDKHKDNICGFVELESKTNYYAEHALVFTLRGALHKWQQPLCFYICEGATSALTLKYILRQMLNEIVKTGLIPVALVSDQGTAFQSAVNNLKEDTRKKQMLAEENIDDTIEIRGQKINVIYDPPHLIKGLRNNFLTKNIIFNGKISKWSDIVDVYLIDCKGAGTRLLPKLNDENVIPEKIKKIKVQNCTCVLSKKVAGALGYASQFSHYADGREVSRTLRNTSETVSFMDDLFDSCNGAELSVKNKGKPLRQAVTNSSKHEVFWGNAIKKLELMRFINKEGTEVNVPSLKNFVTTLKSMLRLWHFFKRIGYKTMRPRYFNSDPDGNFFGQMRA